MKRIPREIESCEPDAEDLEKLELDIDDTQVQVVDGIIVGGDKDACFGGDWVYFLVLGLNLFLVCKAVNSPVFLL